MAIARGTNFCVALRSNGTVVAWGNSTYGQTNVPAGLTNMVAIAAGGAHSLAVSNNGGVVARGSNGSGETTVPSGLTNAMSVAAGCAHSLVLRNDGTVLAWGDNTYGQTNVVSGLTRMKSIAAGANHSLAARFSSFIQYPVDVSKDLLLLYNTSSSNSIVVKDYYLAHRPMVSNANVLGIACPTPSFGCPTNETALPSEFTNNIAAPVAQWLADNPTKRPQYVVLFSDIPSRVSSFNEILYSTNSAPPYEVSENRYTGTVFASVSYQLNQYFAGWRPFVTHINMGDTNACKRYIDKLEFIGTNSSPGNVILSASRRNYGNTNYVVDGVRHGGPSVFEDYSEDGPVVFSATNGLLAAGVPTNSIAILDGLENCTGFITNINGEISCTNVEAKPHLTNAVNVAGYISWGSHSELRNFYALPYGAVKWTGNSSWYIIETIESFNGRRFSDQGNFIQWFSADAFGGTNYSNTPVGAVTHVDEPNGFVNDAAIYFGLWAAGKNFGIAAWNSRRTEYFQAVGDPFVTK